MSHARPNFAIPACQALTMTFNRRYIIKASLGTGFALGLTNAPFITQIAGPLAQPQHTAAGHKLVRQARKQIGITVDYNGAYHALDYPGGDVERRTGVCVDVIIRAYRDAFNIDLQKRIHEDMRANFSAYPNLWQLTRPDRNIDHRRVPNIEQFLTRSGAQCPQGPYRAGDIISMRLANNLPHIAIISQETDNTRQDPSALPQVIHNIGAGAKEEYLPGEISKIHCFRYFP